MTELRASTLTTGQRRSLTVALHQIERELALIADTVAVAAPAPIDPFVDDLDDHTRRQLGQTIAAGSRSDP
jgi:hypothetical protein